MKLKKIIQDKIDKHKSIQLSDIDEIAKQEEFNEKDIFAFLSLATHSSKGFLKLSFEDISGKKIDSSLIQEKLSIRTSSDGDEWAKWAKKINVFWSPLGREG